LNAILEELDHTHLNNLPAFQETNPSSENLARYIFHNLQKNLPYPNIRVREVSVAEKESSQAIYSEPL
jgi:6-pyruvoyltetrahydropterin/6-carboxytetrahydropterin synthase